MNKPAILGALAGLTLGCWKYAPNHCANNEGDAYCGDGKFCSRCVAEHNGCVSEKPTASDDIGPCYAPDGAGGGTSSATGTGTATGTGSATNVTTTNDTVADTSASATQGVDSTMGTTVGSTDTLDSGTETGSTTGSTGCVDNTDCTGDPTKPICVGDTCTTCDKANDPDAACADATPDTPACVGTACVECSETTDAACGGNTPHCDTGTSTCVACTEHAHCPNTACKIPSSFSDANDAEDDEGSCFTGEIIDVNDSQNLNTQIGMVADGTEQVFRLADGNYTDAITVDGGKTIALLAANPGGPVLEQTVTGSPTVTVAGASDGTRLFIHGLELSSNTNNMGNTAVDVSAARFHAQRARLINNNYGALLAENGAYVDMENCYLGDAMIITPAVDVADSSAALLYSTSITGYSMFTDNYVLHCSSATVVVRNSFLGTADMTTSDVDCPGIDVSYTATVHSLAGIGNAVVGAIGMDWFVSIAVGDFDLSTPPAVLLTTAEWHNGDPLVDINGAARPGTDGAQDVAGADLP